MNGHRTNLPSNGDMNNNMSGSQHQVPGGGAVGAQGGPMSGQPFGGAGAAHLKPSPMSMGVGAASS